MVSKRARVVSRRPTSGYCNTCRERKVKCDETRPRCRRCITAGRLCGGYRSWIVTLAPEAILEYTDCVKYGEKDQAVAHQASADVVAARYHCSPVSIPRSLLGQTNVYASDSSKFDFAYFIDRTIDRLLQHSPNPQKSLKCIQLSLSMSQQDPSVYFTVAALGSALRGLSRTMHTSLFRPRDKHNSIVTLEHYEKAVRYRRISIPGIGDRTTAIEPLLITAYLFMALESLRGVAEGWSAERQYRSVRTMVDDFRVSGGLLSPEALCVARNFEHSGFDMSAQPLRSFNSPSVHLLTHSVSPRDGTIRAQPQGVAVFASLSEASALFDSLAEQACRVLAELVQLGEDRVTAELPERSSLNAPMKYCLAHSFSRIVGLGGHKELKIRLDTLQRAHIRFRGELARWTADISDHSVSPFLLLRVRFFTSYVAIMTCRETNEALMDRFRSSFVENLEFAKKILENRSSAENRVVDVESLDSLQSMEPKPSRPTGLFGLGVLPALFAICCKCRDPTVRRDAAGTMRRYIWREINHDSRVLARYAETIMELEQRRAIELYVDLPHYSNMPIIEVPEKARFLDVVVSADIDQSRTLSFVCARVANDERSRIELVECRTGVAADIQSIGTDLGLIHRYGSGDSEDDGGLEASMRFCHRVEIDYSMSIPGID